MSSFFKLPVVSPLGSGVCSHVTKWRSSCHTHDYSSCAKIQYDKLEVNESSWITVDKKKKRSAVWIFGDFVFTTEGSRKVKYNSMDNDCVVCD